MNKITIFCLALLTAACNTNSQQKQQNTTIIAIDPTKDENTLVIDEQAVAQTIALETTDVALLGEINKLQIVNKKLYVADREITEAIFCFDENGKFLYKIDAAGQGPGEYSELDDFAVNSQTDEVVILDADQLKVIFYRQGKFTHEVRLTNDLSFISYNQNGFVGATNYCSNKECNHLFFYDTQFKQIGQALPFTYNSKNIEWDLTLPLYTSFEGTFYTQDFSNTIQLVNNNKVTDFVTIDFGKYNLPEEALKYDRQKMLDYLKTGKGFTFLVDNFMKDENLLYFNFFYNQQMLQTFIPVANTEQYHLYKRILIGKTPVSLQYIHNGFAYFSIEAFDDEEKEEQNPTLLKIPTGKMLQMLKK